MDSHDTKQKMNEDDGFKSVESSETSCTVLQVNKTSFNDILETECNVETKNNDGPCPVIEITNGIKFACDNTSCNDSQVGDCNGFTNCDKKVSASKDTVDIDEHKEVTDNQNDNVSDVTTEMNMLPLTKNITASASQISTNISPNNSELIPNPEITKPNSTTQIPIEEVVEKVNKLDIVEKTNSSCVTPVSSVILKNNSVSLRNLLMYQSESSDEENEDFQTTWQNQVFPTSSCSSDSDSESQECVEISDDDNIEFVTNKNQSKKETKQDFEQMEVATPLDLKNLKIDYEKEQFLHIGHITNFINAMVIIDTLETIDSYDLETVLFVDDKTVKQPLGGITDVIGPVSHPIYCVQLHDVKDIEKLNLKEGMKVYSAPKSVHTKYVFLKDLLKMKGTDASWIGDEEQPSDETDSSDEELIEDWKPRKRCHNNSLERHKRFEKSKNRSNIIKNQVAVMMDGWGHKAKTKRGNNQMFPHGFDPRVPPPNMPSTLQNTCEQQQRPNANKPFGQRWNASRQNNRHRYAHHLGGCQQHIQTNNFFENVGYHQNSPGPSHQHHQ